MMNIISNNIDNQIIVALDIGSSSITCAIAKITSTKNKIKLLGISSKQSSGIKGGIITDRDELIDKLEQVLIDTELMADTKVKSAILSMTGDHVRSINTQAAIALNRLNGNSTGLKMKSINDSDIYQVLDLAQAVSLPADRDILHTLPQEYLVDTLEEIKNPLGMTGRRLEGRVHLVTAATTAMNNLVSSVEELGISIDGLVFQPFASALSTLDSDEMDLGITLVEIGSSMTSIAVYSGNAVRHSAVIPIGSSSITNDIAVMLQMSIKDAERIKIKYSSALSSMSSDELKIDISDNSKQKRFITEKEVSRYVEARMQEIFQMIIREISRADIRDPLTYGIVMTGGGAQLRNIIPLAKKTLGVSVRKGKPIGIEGIEEIANEPRYASAMGLLLWPIMANDHVHFRKPYNQGLKGFINKIKHTIEDIF